MARMTIKKDFRWRFGYRHDHHCKECKHCQKWRMGNHSVYKCEKMGISNSTATDIRLKEFACSLFDPVVDDPLKGCSSGSPCVYYNKYDEKPSAPARGDIWVVTDKFGVLFDYLKYDGSEWVTVEDYNTGKGGI